MIVETAPAKINLALHVRRRRADGYHEIETLFAFCRDGDRVTVTRAYADSFAITGPFAKALEESSPFAPSLPKRGPPHEVPDGLRAAQSERGSENLVLRAVRAFDAAFGTSGGYAITLDKHLPVASGIGGGSADAAATLRALARLIGERLDDPRLFACAESLGSDVPACLLGRTALGSGRGEQLEARDGLTGIPVLLVNPGVAVSTASVFAAWDGVDRGAMGQGAPLAIARRGRNDLEPPARAIAPVIGEVVAWLAAQPDTVLVRMSGSGATCFALFADDRARDRARDRAADAAPREWWAFATDLT